MSYGGPCSKVCWILCGGGSEEGRGRKEAGEGVTWSLLSPKLPSSRLLEGGPDLERRGTLGLGYLEPFSGTLANTGQASADERESNV